MHPSFTSGYRLALEAPATQAGRSAVDYATDMVHRMVSQHAATSAIADGRSSQQSSASAKRASAAAHSAAGAAAPSDIQATESEDGSDLVSKSTPSCHAADAKGREPTIRGSAWRGEVAVPFDSSAILVEVLEGLEDMTDEAMGEDGQRQVNGAAASNSNGDMGSSAKLRSFQLLHTSLEEVFLRIAEMPDAIVLPSSQA